MASRLTFCLAALGLLRCLVVGENSLAQEVSSGTSAARSSDCDPAKRSRDDEIRLGSRTAKAGFQNEDEIRDKFNNWQHDPDAQSWLAEMNYKLDEVVSVQATKPHGQKADVELVVTTKTSTSISKRREGISIKLVSNSTGFNQIDKRWLKTYAEMWAMPEDVQRPLRLFVGEETASGTGHDPVRLHLNDLDKEQQRIVIDFFSKNRKQIVEDLFMGDGQHAAGWFMVTLKIQDSDVQSDESAIESRDNPTGESEEASSKSDAIQDLKDLQTRWVLCPSQVVADYFGDGPVQITKAGNLKIGRITMQRKGGDNGRQTANMLQFKINPVELFSIRKSNNKQPR